MPTPSVRAPLRETPRSECCCWGGGGLAFGQRNLLFSLVKLGSTFPAFSWASSFPGGLDSRSSFESLKRKKGSFTKKEDKQPGGLGLPLRSHAGKPQRTYLKAWTMTVPKRMKRAEKTRDRRGIISRLKEIDKLTNCPALHAAATRTSESSGFLSRAQKDKTQSNPKLKSFCINKHFRISYT